MFKKKNTAQTCDVVQWRVHIVDKHCKQGKSWPCEDYATDL